MGHSFYTPFKSQHTKAITQDEIMSFLVPNSKLGRGKTAPSSMLGLGVHAPNSTLSKGTTAYSSMLGLGSPAPASL